MTRRTDETVFGAGIDGNADVRLTGLLLILGEDWPIFPALSKMFLDGLRGRPTFDVMVSGTNETFQSGNATIW
jgi:hypothetical protein